MDARQLELIWKGRASEVASEQIDKNLNKAMESAPAEARRHEMFQHFMALLRPVLRDIYETGFVHGAQFEHERSAEDEASKE